MASPLIRDARAFFADLSANNTRDWFQANKPVYDEKLRAPALALMEDVAAELRALTGGDITTKLFRPNRDVRFSKDKTPYHTHLHMLWTLAGQDSGPGWFYGISGDYAKAGFGWISFTKVQIATWRMAVDGPYAPAILAALDQTGLTASDPELKRVPTGHAPDHPAGEHLRRKSLTLWQDDVDATPAALMQVFGRTEPLRRQLDGLL